MQQLKIFWHNPSNLFQEVIDSLELMGHQLVKDSSLENGSDQSIKFDIVINVPSNFQEGFISSNFLFLEHSYISSRDEQTLPPFSSVSGYDLNDELLMHHCFIEESARSELVDLIVDFFVEYSRSGIVPKNTEVKKGVYLDRLKLDKKCSLESVFSAIRLIYNFDKAALIEGMCYPNIGLYKISDLEFCTLANQLDLVTFQENMTSSLCLALKWDTVSSDLRTINSMIQINLNQNNVCEIVHVYQDKRQKGFLTYFLNINDNKEQFLSEEEQNALLSGSKNLAFAKSSVIEEIYEHVVQTPNRIAVEDKNSSITYLQLWEEIEKKSRSLLFNNENISGHAIAVGMHKSCDLIVCLLSVLRCGAYYVPLDPTYPPGRISKILSGSNPAMVIVDNDFAKKDALALNEFNVFCYETLELADESVDVKHPEIDFPLPNDLCYVIFTSGSTGEPKGVMIEHHNVVNLAKAAEIELNINANSRILSVASIGFDAAGWDIYGALINGCTVALAPEQIQLNSVELSEFIINYNITIATLTPAVLATLSLDCADLLDILVVMGDKCSNQIMDRWANYTKILNGYGPTEATIGASLNVYSKGQSNLCIGKPLNNYKFLVMNENQQLVPEEVVGELYIAGAGLSRGYLNADNLTNKLFIKKQILDQNIRLYRTGDLVLRRRDGFFEFIGRKDYQIKIRGVRIELEEVEQIIADYDDIDHVVVRVEENQKLVAYIQSSCEIDLFALNQYLGNFLHSAAIPTKIFRVKNFNLTVNGKIDRKNIENFTELNLGTVLLPQNPEQGFIYKVFQNVLNISKFSIRDNFFLLGGHSLSAVSVISQINEHFKAKLPLHLLFNNGSVEEIAGKIQNYISNSSSLTHSRERIGSLTFAQERLWYLYQLDQNDVSYNLPFVLKIEGNLNKTLLEQSLRYIIERHETFRTIFKVNKGNVQQIVLEKIDFVLEHQKNIQNIDLFIEDFCYKPFDLTTDLPFRICLIERNKTDYLLVFVLHNIITDAWSIGVIAKELLAQYRTNIQSTNFVKKESPLNFQLLDVGNYEKQFRTKKLKKEALTYWKQHLENHQILDFPSRERPELFSNKGSSILYKFSSNAWQKIKRYSRNKNCTPFTSLITAMNMWLAKYSNQTDILIGTALSGREGVDIEKMSGFFVNTLPLRTIFKEDDSFDKILNLTKQVVIDAIANQDAAFEWIVEISKTERFVNKNPLFHIMVILQNADENLLPKVPGLTISNYRVPAKYAMFDMVWNFKEYGENLEVDLSYNEALYNANDICMFLDSLDYFLSMVSTHVDIPFQELSVIDKNQENLIIEKSLVKVANFEKERTIIDKIFESYHKYPKSVAVKDEHGSYTYEQLIKTSSLIADKIQQHTNAKNVGVGIYMERSFHLVASIIGVLMSGAYYVPLDPNYPDERLAYIVSNSKIKVILAEQNCDHLIDKSLSIAQFNISQITADNDFIPSLKKIVLPENLAYVIYTSGTTGLPKGVMINHKNIYNLADDFCSRLDLNNHSEFLSITTISFDIFALELFCPLMSAGIHHIVSSTIAKNPVHLVNLLNDTKPTHMQATPTMWRTIIDHIEDEKLIILCGGENLDKSLFEKFNNKYQRVYNVYGPTETTVWSSCGLLREHDTISIGKPIQNTQCFILDESESLCPFNVWGELVIAGDGVGRGYINNHDLTKKLFKEIKIADQKFLVYKTGDKAKLLNNGYIVCSGRYDSQIKLRGHRIELQEIESVLNQLQLVSMSAVKLWGEGNSAYLVAYIVLSSTMDDKPAIDLIKSQISEKLSPVMVPSGFQILEHLPKTSNGKINRKALDEPVEKGSLSENQFVHPKNDREKFIKETWERIINITNISVIENFFVIGGNSIHIPQIVHEINRHYMLELTIRDFILHSTIRELSEYITNQITIDVKHSNNIHLEELL